jgi:Zn-finger nucleic acid-binding protein
MIWSVATHCFFCGNLVGEEGCSLCGTVRSSRDERRVRAPCPRCGTEARLVPFGLGEAALQACPRCKGLFVSAIDWDTLLTVFAQEPLPDIVVPDAEGVSTYGPYRSAPTSNREPIDLEPPIRCPTCNETMERLEFGVMTHVIIDVCATHGVWLDAGELERIIESVHPHLAPEPVFHKPLIHEPLLSIPETLAQAAKEPITPKTVDDAVFIAPETEWKQSIPRTSPVPASLDADRGPWTAQLGRALRQLVRSIIPHRRRTR